MSETPRPVEVAWISQSGRRCPFGVVPIGQTYLSKPGIYVFCARREGTYFALHFGETEDFRRTLTEELERHPAYERLKAEGVSHVGTHYFPGSSEDRQRVIDDIVARLNPPLQQV